MPALASEIVFEVGPKAVEQRDLVEHLNGISAKLRSFLAALVDTAISLSAASNEVKEPQHALSSIFKKEAFVDYLKSTGQKHSDSLISTRLTELRKLGVVTTERRRTQSKKVHHHKIDDLYGLVQLPPLKSFNSEAEKEARRRTKEMLHVQFDFLKDDKFNILQPPKLDKGYHDRLLHGILDVCMRLSSKDSRREITVTTDLVGLPLKITSKVIGETGDLAALPDQRCQRAIISLVKHEIDMRVAKLKTNMGVLDYPSDSSEEYQLLKDKIDNLFAVNIYTLCDEIRLPKRHNNAQRLVNMMSRLANTVYDVDASKNEWFKRTFSLSGHSDQIRIQFLQNFETASEPPQFLDLFSLDEGELIPHIYTFSLDPRIFYSIIDPERTSIFLSHPELRGENSGIAQRFYNWCRAYITGNDKMYLKGRNFTLREMHKCLTPAARYDNFHPYFLRMLEKFCIGEWDVHGTSTSKIYGYIVIFESRGKDSVITIERDSDDPIVGDNSVHQRLLRKQRKEVHQG